MERQTEPIGRSSPPDGEACFVAALGDVAAEAQPLFLQAAGSGGGAALVDAAIAFASKHRARATVLFCESLAGPAEARRLREELIGRLAREIEARPGPSGLAIPASVLVGGLFRLLALRLRSSEPLPAALASDLHAWVDSYEGSPPAGWTGGWAAPRRWRRSPPVAGMPGRLEHPPPGQSAAELARGRRERILYATVLEAYRSGYAALSVSGIVELAGLSNAAFSAEFDDKKAAAMAALQVDFELLITTSASAFYGAAGWPERIEAVARSLSEHFQTHPALSHLALLELPAIGPEAMAVAHERLMAFTLLFEEGRRMAAPGSELPALAVEATLATILELACLEAPRPGVERLPDLERERIYVALAPFLGVEQVADRRASAAIC